MAINEDYGISVPGHELIEKLLSDSHPYRKDAGLRAELLAAAEAKLVPARIKAKAEKTSICDAVKSLLIKPEQFKAGDTATQRVEKSGNSPKTTIIRG